METPLISAPEVPWVNRLPKPIRRFGWAALAVVSLLFFTLVKLPEDRLKSFIHGTLQAALSQRGMSYSASRSEISVGFGISYLMKDVTIGFPPPQPPVKLDQVYFSPYLFSMIFGRMGGSFRVTVGDGTMKGSASVHGTKAGFSFKAKSLNLEKLGLLEMLSGVKASALVDGSGSFSGDTTIPSTSEGDIDVKLSKVVLDSQSLMGFQIPRMNVSEGKIDLRMDRGRATIQTLSLGKPGSADDLQLTATGSVALSRTWESSGLDLKIKFKVSEPVYKSLGAGLLDALLGNAKQPDGSYAYKVTGSPAAPNFVPGT